MLRQAMPGAERQILAGAQSSRRGESLTAYFQPAERNLNVPRTMPIAACVLDVIRGGRVPKLNSEVEYGEVPPGIRRGIQLRRHGSLEKSVTILALPRGTARCGSSRNCGIAHNHAGSEQVWRHAVVGHVKRAVDRLISCTNEYPELPQASWHEEEE